MNKTPQQRRQEQVAAFEARRNGAQYAAALDLWRQGDVSAAERSLREILSRNPDYRAARLALAELLLDRGDAAGALALLELPQTQAADSKADSKNDLGADPRYQHLLGLSLEGAGRTNEAIACFRRAAELDPASELYQATLESAGVPAPTSAARARGSARGE